MIQIKNSDLGILGIATQLDIQVTTFNTSATKCTLYYTLHSEDGKQLADGRHELTEAEYTEWGSDNSYIENIVLNSLNLERK